MARQVDEIRIDAIESQVLSQWYHHPLVALKSVHNEGTQRMGVRGSQFDGNQWSRGTSIQQRLSDLDISLQSPLEQTKPHDENQQKGGDHKQRPVL
jgi:hypothetical protein